MGSIDTRFAGREREWVFSGRTSWTERDGRLHSPMFSAPLFDLGPHRVPNLYADYQLFDEHPEMRFRWEFAFPSPRFLSDVDIGVDLENFYSSGAGCGLVLRAQDDNRYYSVEVLDMGVKGSDYRVALMRSDASGYAVELAAGYAPHSPMPPDIVQGRFARFPDALDWWWRSSPAPARLRVTAVGDHIAASLDGKPVWEVVDGTYAAGLSGLAVAIDSPARYSRFTLSGTEAEGTWARADYAKLVTYPVPRHRLGGWYGNPGLGRAPDGRILLWFGCAEEGIPGWDWRKGDEATAFAVSSDEGRTWSEPRLVRREPGCTWSGHLFAHRDGTWSYFGSRVEATGVAAAGVTKGRHLTLRSSDGGASWEDAGETSFARTILKMGWSRFYLYGVPFRISDGTVLMTGYRREQMPGTAGESNDRLNDQSFVLRSEDDGFTWSEPVLIDRTVFDTNECMIAESSPGTLVSFSRTLRGRTMWTATSRDGGRTWSDLAESGEPGDSPCMLAHSSGLLVMTSRDTVGTRVAVSADRGRTWSLAGAGAAQQHDLDGRASRRPGLHRGPDRLDVPDVDPRGYVPGHSRGAGRGAVRRAAAEASAAVRDPEHHRPGRHRGQDESPVGAVRARRRHQRLRDLPADDPQMRRVGPHEDRDVVGLVERCVDEREPHLAGVSRSRPGAYSMEGFDVQVEGVAREPAHHRLHLAGF